MSGPEADQLTRLEEVVDQAADELLRMARAEIVAHHAKLKESLDGLPLAARAANTAAQAILGSAFEMLGDDGEGPSWGDVLAGVVRAAGDIIAAKGEEAGDPALVDALCAQLRDAATTPHPDDATPQPEAMH